MAGGLGPRQKGNRFERECVDDARATPGLDGDRTWGSNGRTRGLPEEVDVLLYEGTKDDHTTCVHLQAKRGKTQPAYLTLPEADTVLRVTETSTGKTYYVLRYRLYLDLWSARATGSGAPSYGVVDRPRKKLGDLYKPGPDVVGQVFRGDRLPAHITLHRAEYARVTGVDEGAPAA